MDVIAHFSLLFCMKWVYAVKLDVVEMGIRHFVLIFFNSCQQRPKTRILQGLRRGGPPAFWAGTLPRAGKHIW